MADSQTDATVKVTKGQKIDLNSIPTIPEKQDYTGKWLYSNTEFIAETEISSKSAFTISNVTFTPAE